MDVDSIFQVAHGQFIVEKGEQCYDTQLDHIGMVKMLRHTRYPMKSKARKGLERCTEASEA